MKNIWVVPRSSVQGLPGEMSIPVGIIAFFINNIHFWVVPTFGVVLSCC